MIRNYVNGASVVEQFKLIGNDEWYYLNTDGSMHTGWLNKDGLTYLLQSNGSMAHDTEIYGYSIDSNGHAIKIN